MYSEEKCGNGNSLEELTVNIFSNNSENERLVDYGMKLNKTLDICKTRLYFCLMTLSVTYRSNRHIEIVF